MTVLVDSPVHAPFNIWICKPGYAQFRCPMTKTNKYLHRWLMLDPIGMFVDHIDGNKLNNQLHNLRVVTPRESTWNLGKRKNASGFTGVHETKQGNWQARAHNMKPVNLGTFKTKQGAIDAVVTWYDNNMPERAAFSRR